MTGKNYDEPHFIDVPAGNSGAETGGLKREIAELLEEQPFAVLATEGEGQPYTSLISFAMSKDLRYLIFSTPIKTKKYDQITRNNRVSILVDSRSEQPDSINNISAVTITGQAGVITDQSAITRWSKILVAKHGYLKKFIYAPSSGLVLVTVESYYYVRHFQEVFQWTPPA